MDVDPDVEVVYSGESDSPSDSKSTAKAGPKGAGTDVTTVVSRDKHVLRHEMFGSSNESEHSQPGSERSRSRSQNASVQNEGNIGHGDDDDSSRGRRSRSNSSNCRDHSASVHTSTTQEENDRNVLRFAPEIKPWMPSSRKLKEWYGFTAGSCRIPLFDSSKIHGLDSSAKNYRTEHEYYIDVFFKHRWYHGNRNRDENSLVRAWNSFIISINNVGCDSWLDKLVADRKRFMQKSPTGARFKLYRLSREAGLPCLAWGENCQSCVDNSARAPREAFLPNQPYWRARLSSEMYEGIENSQSLYERVGRSFDDGPPSAKGASRRTARRDRAHPPSAGNAAPSYSKKVDNPATGRGNSLLILNRHGGSRCATQGSVDHRGSPPKDVEEEENPPSSHWTHHPDSHEMNRAILDLREDLEHERSRRYAITDLVREQYKDRESDRAKDRTGYAVSQLQVERSVRSLVDELAAARKEISRLTEGVSSLCNRTDSLECERKNLMAIIERGGYIHRRKKSRTDSTGGDAPRKT